MKLRIAILGTRGIPNNYGGFEQISSFLSAGLHKRGHEVTVYNSHNHPYQKKSWNGVHIEHCYDPEYLLKTAGQFIYDLNCIRNARNKEFDVILFMGYTSSSVWHSLFPKKKVIVSNMDGFEWKRTKYSKPVRKFLKYAETLAVKHSHFHIADSVVMQDYLNKKYGIQTHYISYGASTCSKIIKTILHELNIRENEYFLLMARMEPENNIEMILDGFHQSKTFKKFIIIGNTSNRYGTHLVSKYSSNPLIDFIGPVFDQDKIHTLRTYACLYFHGHSVGGTNPSLLEAMASKCPIAAHDNDFNKSVLQDDAYYFSDSFQVKKLIEETEKGEREMQMIEKNMNKIIQTYNCEKIVDQYEDFLIECFKKNRQ